MKYLKILGWSLIVAIAVLSLTNPSMKQFEDFVGGKNGENMNNYSGKHYHLRRTSNWLIFSVYQKNKESYLAIFNNFYESSN
jgi:hypothetical protein